MGIEFLRHAPAAACLAVFRGERHCDGGLTNFIPIPPSTVGVRVCCFPSKQLSPVYRWAWGPSMWCSLCQVLLGYGDGTVRLLYLSCSTVS
jgi:hypothetical protein